VIRPILDRGENIITDGFRREFVGNALESYRRTSGTDPERAVVDRDGVSLGQMVKLKKIEVLPIVEMLKSVIGHGISLPANSDP